MKKLKFKYVKNNKYYIQAFIVSLIFNIPLWLITFNLIFVFNYIVLFYLIYIFLLQFLLIQNSMSYDEYEILEENDK